MNVTSYDRGLVKELYCILFEIFVKLVILKSFIVVFVPNYVAKMQPILIRNP